MHLPQTGDIEVSVYFTFQPIRAYYIMDKSFSSGAKRPIGPVYSDSSARGLYATANLYLTHRSVLLISGNMYINELYLLWYFESYYPKGYRTTCGAVLLAADAHFVHFGNSPGHAAYACA